MRILLPLLLLGIPVFASADRLIGEAKNRKGELVYREKHEVHRDAEGLNRRISVEYLRPDGTVFATMSSDFSKSPTLPEIRFEDRRFARGFTLKLNGSAVEFEDLREGRGVSKTSRPFRDGMVAGQGFDNFIRLNRARLEAGPVDFLFGIPEKKDFYSLTGRRHGGSGDDGIEYRIRAASWLIRLFADELRVVYDAKTLRLASFSGRSNIPDDQDRPQDVDIRYRWENSP